MNSKLFLSMLSRPFPAHLYFIAILVLMYSQNPHPNSVYSLIFTLPFLFQLLFKVQWLNVVLGLLALALSLLLFFGFFSQLTKPGEISTPVVYVLLWAVIAVLSPIMSVWLFMSGLRAPARENQFAGYE